ncbi:MAG: PaaI family thioesterase [Candidatus Hermodarchaeota archaeon]
MSKHENNDLKGQTFPGIGQLMGIHIVDYSKGEAILDMNIDERFWNPMGITHGGVFCDLADAAFGVTFFSTLNDNEGFTTVNLQINFLKSIKTGKITAKARMIRRGKRIGYMECDISDSNGNLLAKANSTCLVIKRDS